MLQRNGETGLLFTLTLTDDGAPPSDKKYIRITPSSCKTLIRWILPPGTLAALDQAILYTNYPMEGIAFDRGTFYKKRFKHDPELHYAYCDLVLDYPGAYKYYVKYGAQLEHTSSSAGRMVVEPDLTLPSDGFPLPMDALMIQSVVPKWMGPMKSWDRFFKFIRYSGYNMIHFVPMQQRGSSDSPYALADQLTFSDGLFEDASTLCAHDRYVLVKKTLGHLERNYGMLALSDVVWTHTSNDSPFLLDHPDVGYNLHNSPHLVSAYELDSALVNLSGQLDQLGLKSTIDSTADVEAIVGHIQHYTIPDLRLYEYRVVNVAKYMDLMRKQLAGKLSEGIDTSLYQALEVHNLSLKQQVDLVIDRHLIADGPHIGTRFHKTINIPEMASFLLALDQINDTNQVLDYNHIQHLIGKFKMILDEYNLPFYHDHDRDMHVAVENIKSRMIFVRLAENGPHLGPITSTTPLVESYFARLDPSKSSQPVDRLQLVKNGWLWSADYLTDFAGPGSSVYLRREVMIYDDVVKLRFGAGPDDNPWLWNHMTKYTEQVASLFHGIRIDSCHSTPVHVAEYLLDAARRVRPHLFILAELFTGSEEKDNYYVPRLGIHALIREAIQAWDTHELSRLVHRHGGMPVGSMDEDMTWTLESYQDNDTHDDGNMAISRVYKTPILHGSSPRALFMDCTHDNETPLQRRLAQDALPNAAVVAFSACSTGSVKGYDELHPRLLDIVNEKRLYGKPDTSVGIVEIKHQLQNLHLTMSKQGYNEVHVHQENDYLLVHRQHPETQDGYLLIARTAFPNAHTGVSPIILRKSQAKYMFGASLKVDDTNFDSNGLYLTGLQSQIDSLPCPSLVDKVDENGEFLQVVFDPSRFLPGSIMVLQTWIDDIYKETRYLVSYMDDYVVEDLDLMDVNIVLYRCENEERESTGGSGVYVFPGYGPLVYAGLQGFMTVLEPIILNSDLGHPVCDNLRQGKWALEYVVARLDKYLPHAPHLTDVRAWLHSRLDKVKQLPDFLIPKYFALAIQTAYNKVYNHAVSLMSPLIQQTGDPFFQQLGMTSVQLLGHVPSSSLYPHVSVPSLASGIPHFTTGPFRTWGRDTFVALRGLLLVTGRYDDARQHILAFASALQHGLIPNLLDSGRQPRYNSRDAVWFFLQAIQDYTLMAPNGIDLLNDVVERQFLNDDGSTSSSIAEIIQEILQHHALGIHFREHNAGLAIDSLMTDNGFNIDIQVDWQTGLLVGGNLCNCGTWMDKMGGSEKAQNKGVPGTSRDGAAIEISGLLKSALRWVVQLKKKGHFKWTGAIIDRDGNVILYEDWNNLIQENFEKAYYIPTDPAEDINYYLDSSKVDRRGIYKDVWMATKGYTEYQFRPNFTCAMVVAPELFNRDHARHCLKLTNKVLRGPIGMRTLDPSDLEYRPYYNTNDDSADFEIAKGRNYHQGPEWVWLMGYFLRASLAFEALSHAQVARTLRSHRNEIASSHWRGLPELTNKDGVKCQDACFTQAWSSSSVLDVLYDTFDKKTVRLK